jgi:hypothetical protein
LNLEILCQCFSLIRDFLNLNEGQVVEYALATVGLKAGMERSGDVWFTSKSPRLPASVNSKCAPLGPRRRNRASRRMRFRCAKSISTFLQSRRIVQTPDADQCTHACSLLFGRIARLVEPVSRQAGQLPPECCQENGDVPKSPLSNRQLVLPVGHQTTRAAFNAGAAGTRLCAGRAHLNKRETYV